jgi:hypothetical protein
MSTDLSTSQLVRCAVLGAVLWLCAAFLLRWLGPMGIYNGWGRVLLFAAIVPGTLPFVLLCEKAAGLARSQLFAGFSFGTATAVCLDGLALSWTPGLYGGEAYVAGAGATILWGGGVGLFLAYLMGRRGRA